ncbi:MAG: diphthine--ammonia ligase [Thermoprotei archaeon]
MFRLRAVALFTGGKDSTYALHLAYLQGYDVEALVSILPIYENSLLYHKPIDEIVKLQARCLKLPLLTTTVSEPANELEALYRALKQAQREYGVRVVVSGAVLSDYQRFRFMYVADKLGLKVYTPLWGVNQENYLLELIDNGIEFIIVSISAYGFPPEYLGKVITREIARQILRLARKYGFNPSFEGGEAETLVVYAPLFKNRLVVEGEVVSKGPWNHIYIIKNVYLQ